MPVIDTTNLTVVLDLFEAQHPHMVKLRHTPAYVAAFNRFTEHEMYDTLVGDDHRAILDPAYVGVTVTEVSLGDSQQEWEAQNRAEQLATPGWFEIPNRLALQARDALSIKGKGSLEALRRLAREVDRYGSHNGV